jgi:hypothetical protein
VTPPTSRTQAARRRAVGAKRTAATAAAAGFLAIALLARGSDPGQASPAASGSNAGSSVTSQEQDDFSLDPGSLTQSSGSTPSAKTSVS